MVVGNGVGFNVGSSVGIIVGSSVGDPELPVLSSDVDHVIVRDNIKNIQMLRQREAIIKKLVDFRKSFRISRRDNFKSRHEQDMITRPRTIWIIFAISFH